MAVTTRHAYTRPHRDVVAILAAGQPIMALVEIESSADCSTKPCHQVRFVSENSVPAGCFDGAGARI